MKIARSVRIILITLASLVVIVGLITVLSISTIDRSIDYEVLLDTMNARIDALDAEPVESTQGFTIGFAKVNLTPPQPRATAGYGKRLGKLYKSVHDSIYVRSFVVDNGIQRVAIVSADLLIIPPTVTALLKDQLPEVNFTLDNTYMGATHSHNSIGNWATGATSFIYGMYEDSVVQFIADKIKASILQASQNMLPANASIDSVAIPDGVRNRIDDDGPVDPLLRMIRIERSDSTKLLIASYTAHATCLFSRDLELSGDYPGKLIQILESQGYDFAMFMAGSVGSHKPRAPEGGWECVDWMAEKIAENVKNATFQPMKSNFLEMHLVPLALSEPQAKVSEDWRMNPGLFKVAFGDFPVPTALRFGDAVMLWAL